jgi:AsmA-like C-terminal region
MGTSRRLRIGRWVIIAAGGVLVVLAIIAGAGSRTPTLRSLVVETLADRLSSEVELQAFSVDTFPTVDVRGEGLVVRLRGRRDVPPLVKVRSFRITGGVFGLLSRPRRFRTVTVEGLEINIPPGGVDLKNHDEADARSEPADAPSTSPIHIDALEASDAMLRLIPRRAGKDPREFPIRSLRMSRVGITQRMPFEAELTNPLPRGFIRTRGRFGPWGRDDPGATPVQGKYVFDNADLSTIKGIGGILASTGEFRGTLDHIEVKGETRTPDFRLDLTNKPIPLSTRFEAVVDGTNGDTYLNEVDAELRQTRIIAKGAVVDDTPGVKGRAVKLHVRVPDGRIEDLLHLAVKSPQPVMTGRVTLHTDFLLPSGQADVIDRLRLSGQFDLSGTRFTDAGVRDKLASMSARAKGDPDDVRERVISDLEGTFTLANGRVSMSALKFRIPGAVVQLAGTYGLRSEAIDFDGTLRMDATISEAAGGGMKSIFLKVFDPLFRKKGAGSVLPIKVRGTRENPEFKLDVGKALTPK